MQDFNVGDPIQWLQKFDEIEYPVQGIVELVEEGVLTVRDTLGQFWRVTEADYPKKVWE